jgi:hypothetical protein
MINDNLIEIKTFVNPHPTTTVNNMATKLTVLPGRVAVLCDPHVEHQGQIFVAPGKYRGSQDSDTGTVISSGVKTLKLGDRVAFLPTHGIRCTAEEFDWVPPGLEVRIYGVACPYDDSLTLLD